MPGMTHGAGGEAFAHGSGAQAVNCAHLHSAFGPGCPYCARAAAAPVPAAPVATAPVATAASSIHGRPPDQADVSMGYGPGGQPDLDEIIHPDREPDLGAVA